MVDCPRSTCKPPAASTLPVETMRHLPPCDGSLSARNNFRQSGGDEICRGTADLVVFWKHPPSRSCFELGFTILEDRSSASASPCARIARGGAAFEVQVIERDAQRWRAFRALALDFRCFTRWR